MESPLRKTTAASTAGPDASSGTDNDLAFVLTGGGARAAYQVGVLAWIAERFPDLHLPILTGVSAGAVNASHIAGHHGTFAQSVTELVSLWSELRSHEVFRAGPISLGWSSLRWLVRLGSGGSSAAPRVRGLLDTAPLRETLEEATAAVQGVLTGIDYNLHRGTLKAVAISTTSYTTGQSIVWVQGKDIELWERPQRRSIQARLTIDHVMASAALPLFFPAVRISNGWYGDGGIRLAAPLSPALHLGAQRVLAISTRHAPSMEEADRPDIAGYPPPAQIFGLLMNAVFLDLIDQDALRLERMNRVLERLPRERRDGLRIVKLLTIRPSRDLGRVTAEYEPTLPPTLRFLTRGLGTRETDSPDILSMLLFEPEYLSRLIDLGKADAEARADELYEFLAADGAEQAEQG